MKKTTTQIVHQTEGKRSYGIKVKTDNDTFTIPVIDVRDGEQAREAVNTIAKNSRRQTGSKFMSRTYGSGGNSYQVSQK